MEIFRCLYLVSAFCFGLHPEAGSQQLAVDTVAGAVEQKLLGEAGSPHLSHGMEIDFKCLPPPPLQSRVQKLFLILTGTQRPINLETATSDVVKLVLNRQKTILHKGHPTVITT